MAQARKQTSRDVTLLAEAVARLSRLLTRERDRLPEAYLRDAGLRDAYLRYFLPVNRAKIGVPLAELSLHPAGFLSRERIRALDIGTGPGTSLLGLLDFFRGFSSRPVLDFTAVDAVAANLAEAERMFRQAAEGYGGTASLATAVRSFGAGPLRVKGPFDVIILSNVLNELFPAMPDAAGRRAALLAQLITEFLAGDGACIVIEPSLRETSRGLLLVRDELIRQGLAIYSPCLTREPCPALIDPRDWCHEDRPWDPPQLVREIDSVIGLRKDSLKFSYLVVRRDEHTLARCVPGGSLRVVSEPLLSKGKRELFVCGAGGRRPVMRQDKDASPGNAAFELLRRGDLVRFEGAADDGKRLRVTKKTIVTAGSGCQL